ncbi:MAG: ABC transporter permease [Pirellulales bacterium]|nr:ABC transporter permease [Pirellulales bacterium]
MSVLNRKLLREFWQSKGMLLAITALIAVGVMGYIYMKSAYQNLLYAQREYYALCRMADFWIDLKKAPVAEIEPLGQIAGVSELRPRIANFATVDIATSLEPVNAYVVSLPDQRQPVINDVVLKRGSYFTDERRNEVLVTESFAKKHKLYPGMWLSLILNNRREELFIVGTAISSEFVYLVSPGSIIPDPQRFGVFYVKHSYAEEVFGMEGAANQLLGRLTPANRARPENVLAQLERRLESYGVLQKTPLADQPSNRFLSDEIRGIGVFSTIMPSMFLVVGALVLYVLMTRLIDQQRIIIGTLKAVGYSDGQLFVHYSLFGAVIGVAGGVVGGLAGYLLSVLVTEMYKTLFEFPNLTNRLDWQLYATGGAISLGCALFGAGQGAWAAIRLRPAEAMRARPPKQGGKILLERWTWLWSRLSFGWRMSLRNIFRQKTRSGVTIFAAMMGAALTFTGFTLQYCLRYLIDFQFEKIMRSDIDLSFKEERDGSALDEARQLPGVHDAEPLLTVACDFVNGPYRRKGAISGLWPGGRLTIPRDLVGNPCPIRPDGLTMTRKLADILHVSAGDRITIIPNKGLRAPKSVPISQITDSYLGLNVYADLGYLNRLIDEEDAITGVQLVMDRHPGSYAEFCREVKQLPALQAFNSRSANVRNLFDTFVKMQDVVISLIIIFAGIIFFASLLNTSLINLAERRREIATLRVLGYTPWQIGGFFWRESLTLNILGTLLGFPVGFLLVWYMTVVYNTEMFRFPLVMPPSVWIKTFLAALLFGSSAQLLVLREIFVLDWRDALNVKE